VPRVPRSEQLAGIPGTVELAPDPGNSLGTELSHKYLREDPPPDPESVHRYIVRVIPEKVNVFAAG